MEFLPIRTPIIRPGDDLAQIILDALKALDLSLVDGDILVVAETIIATVQGRIVDLNTISPTEISPRARDLATRYEMDPRLVQLVERESEEILGGVHGVLLASIHGILIANAGIDASNSGGEGLVVLLPENPWKYLKALRSQLMAETGKQIGLVLADSRVQPLKRGVSGVAIATAGIEPIEDCRGQIDLFGRPLRMTFRAVADDLASAAQLLFGEADEQIPVVLARGAPVKLTENPQYEDMTITASECLYVNAIREHVKPREKS